MHELDGTCPVEELGLVRRLGCKLGTHGALSSSTVLGTTLLHDSIGEDLTVKEGHVVLAGARGEILVVDRPIRGELVY